MTWTHQEKDKTSFLIYILLIFSTVTSTFYYSFRTHVIKEYDSVISDYDYHARRYKSDWGKFTTPDTLLTDVYNLQVLNRYSYVYNNPYKYRDSNGHEPSRDQAGQLKTVVEYIKEIESNPDNADKTSHEILSIVQSTFSPKTYGESKYSDSSSSSFVPNFIYTSDKGVIDNMHFFTNAKYEGYLPGPIGYGADYLVELYQLGTHSSSAFTYEDFISNRLGRQFGSMLTDDEPLSVQYERFMKNLKAKNTYPAWLWNLMPNTQPEHGYVDFNRMNFFGNGLSLPNIESDDNGWEYVPSNGDGGGDYYCFGTGCPS